MEAIANQSIVALISIQDLETLVLRNDLAIFRITHVKKIKFGKAGKKKIEKSGCSKNLQIQPKTRLGYNIRTYVLDEFSTADCSCTTKYFWKNSYKSL